MEIAGDEAYQSASREEQLVRSLPEPSSAHHQRHGAISCNEYPGAQGCCLELVSFGTLGLAGNSGTDLVCIYLFLRILFPFCIPEDLLVCVIRATNTGRQSSKQ